MSITIHTSQNIIELINEMKDICIISIEIIIIIRFIAIDNNGLINSLIIHNSIIIIMITIFSINLKCNNNINHQ